MGVGKPQGQWVVAVLDGFRAYRTIDDLLRGASPVPFSELQRRILETLIEEHNKSADLSSLIRQVWGNSPPATAKMSLHNQISRIRKLTSADLLITTDRGYRLNCATDIDLISETTRVAQDELNAGLITDSSEQLHRIALYVRRSDVSATESHALLVEELESTALVVLVETGRVSAAIEEGERLVQHTPLNEYRWMLLARAFRDAGRRSEALAVIDRARRILRTELGISIGAELSALETSMLRSDRTQRIPIQIPLVGRDAVVSQLVDVCTRGVSSVLVGESGGGRSAVLREVRSHLRRRSRRVGFAECDPNAATATAVFDDLLDDLGESGNWPTDVVEGFNLAVATAAAKGPLTLIVDDIDEAGPSVVSALVRCAASPGVSVLCSATSGIELPLLAQLETVALPLLDSDSSHALVDAHLALRPALSHSAKEQLVALAGGNPAILSLLLTDDQFFHMLAEGESIDISAGRSVALDHLVEQQLQRLNRSGRTAVDAAAVLGSGGSSQVLEAMTSKAATSDAMQGGILRLGADTRFRFAAEAVGRAVYERMPVGRRSDLHRAAAQLCREHGESIELVASHSLRSASLSPAVAIADCIEAGDSAAGKGLNHDSREWFATAVSLLDDIPSPDPRLVIRSRIGLGNAMRLIGDPRHLAELVAVTKDALELGDLQLVCDAVYALLQLGGVSGPGAEQAEALRLAHKALKVLDGSELWALIAAAITQVGSVFAPQKSSHSRFAKALQVARSVELRKKVLPYASLELGHPRDLALRERVADELRQIALDTQDPFAMFSAAQLDLANSFVRGDNQQAAESLKLIENLVHQTGSVGHHWETKYAAAAVHDLQGNIELSDELSREAFEIFGRVMPLRAEAVRVCQQFALHGRWGTIEELEPVLASIRDRQPTLGAWLSLHAFACHEIDPDTARHELQQSLVAVPEDFTWLASHTVGGMAAARLGDSELGRRYLEILTPWSDLVASPLVSVFWPVQHTIDALNEVVTASR